MPENEDDDGKSHEHVTVEGDMPHDVTAMGSSEINPNRAILRVRSSFGSDVAARLHRATLSDNALVHVPKGAAFACGSAAMATNMQPVKSRAKLLMRKMVRWLMLHELHLLRSL